jgi:hypothetical protein
VAYKALTCMLCAAAAAELKAKLRVTDDGEVNLELAV